MKTQIVRFSSVALLLLLCSGCVVSTAASVAKDVVVGTVDIATDVVGTAVDVAKPGKRKK